MFAEFENQKRNTFIPIKKKVIRYTDGGSVFACVVGRERRKEIIQYSTKASKRTKGNSNIQAIMHVMCVSATVEISFAPGQSVQSRKYNTILDEALGILEIEWVRRAYETSQYKT